LVSVFSFEDEPFVFAVLSEILLGKRCKVHAVLRLHLAPSHTFGK